MKAAVAGPLAAFALAGCIPQAEPPPGYRAGDAATANWPYGGRRRSPAPIPARAVPPPPAEDSDEVSAANRRSLDEVERPRETADRAGDDAPPVREVALPPSRPPRASYRPKPMPEPMAAEAADRRGEAVPAPPPNQRPAWEVRPVEPDAREIADGSYTVRPGETLHAAGEATGVGAEALIRANDLQPPFALRAGQRLRVPGGRYHLVRPGQAGIAIARAYGLPWSRIVDANALAEPYTLHVGQRILIPGEPVREGSAAERAATFTLDVDDILTGGEPALAANQAPARPVATATRVLPPSAAVAPPARLTGAFAWPADGRLLRRFGHGESGYRNDGIEIALPQATPVHAAADGVVAYAGEGIAALGGLLIVRHGDGWTTVYGHTSKLLVQRGQAVKRGQTIALSGDTGYTDRPELHFELRRGRTPVDPLTQLPER